VDLSAASVRRALAPKRIATRLRVRAGVEDWLRDADLRRHGLPSSAIAIVRQLRVPWGKVAGPPGSSRYDTLEAALRSAQRPALEHGALRAGPAVWFVDQPELLACLARDAIAGQLNARWWWPALLHGEVDRAAALRYWTASARAVPQAVERLQPMDLGTVWFESWTTAARHDLVESLARHFPVSAAVRRFVDAGTTTSGALHRDAPADSAECERSRDRHSGDDDAAWLPSAVPSPPIRLHRLCLSLARDPACAFDERYVERALLRHARPADETPPLDASVAPAAHRPAPATSQSTSAGDGYDADGSRVPVGHAHLGRDPHPARAAASMPRARAAALGVQLQDPAGTAAAREFTAPGYSRVPVAAVSGARVASTAFDEDTVVETGHGGLFFVINAALQLGLYGDFSQPLHRGLEMSPWRFLYETGAAFGGRRFVRDPLAVWLERFQTRDSEPASSVSAAAPGSLGPTTRAHCAPRRPRLRKAAPGAPSITLAGVLPQLKARLVLALGLRDPRRLAGTLLRLPAQVRVGGERIDVYFPLQHLPIAIRLAGLDRDPGWVPAAGCDLRFHFE